MAAAEADTDGESTPEVSSDRWPLLPDNQPHAPQEAPYSARAIVRRMDKKVLRCAIAITTRKDVLRNIVEEELQLTNTRTEVIQLANQQLDRVKHYEEHDAWRAVDAE